MAVNPVRQEARRIKSRQTAARRGWIKGKTYKGKRLARMGYGKLRVRA